MQLVRDVVIEITNNKGVKMSLNLFIWAIIIYFILFIAAVLVCMLTAKAAPNFEESQYGEEYHPRDVDRCHEEDEVIES